MLSAWERKMTPTTGSSGHCSVISATMLSAAPSAREPVSPMKSFAG